MTSAEKRAEYRRTHSVSRTTEWRRNHREQYNKWSREWYAKHKESERKRSIEKLKRFRAKYQQYFADYAERNKEKLREKAVLWRATHKTEKAEMQRQWRAKNPEKNREYHNRRRALRVSVGGRFTSDEWKNLVLLYNSTCLSCFATDKKLFADHIVPLSKGGANDIGNIQPLCKSCNSKKYNKVIDYRWHEVHG